MALLAALWRMCECGLINRGLRQVPTGVRTRSACRGLQTFSPEATDGGPLAQGAGCSTLNRWPMMWPLGVHVQF